MIRRRWRDKSELKRKLNLLLCSTGNLHNSTNKKYIFEWYVNMILFYSVRYVCRIIMYCIILWYDMCDAIYNLQNKFQRNSFWQTYTSMQASTFWRFLWYFSYFFIFLLKGFFSKIFHMYHSHHIWLSTCIIKL